VGVYLVSPTTGPSWVGVYLGGTNARLDGVCVDLAGLDVRLIVVREWLERTGADRFEVRVHPDWMRARRGEVCDHRERMAARLVRVRLHPAWSCAHLDEIIRHFKNRQPDAFFFREKRRGSPP
jgi:hypothetical protein